LAKLDGRTKESHLVRETRAELTAYVGGNPTTVQRALIEQLAQIKLRLAVMDRKFVNTRAQTDLDSRMYLAWANTYSRMLVRLGVRVPESHTVDNSLADYLDAKRAAREAAD
jgi:hypothetical protein